MRGAIRGVVRGGGTRQAPRKEVSPLRYNPPKGGGMAWLVAEIALFAHHRRVPCTLPGHVAFNQGLLDMARASSNATPLLVCWLHHCFDVPPPWPPLHWVR